MTEILSPFGDGLLEDVHGGKLASVAAGELVAPITVEVDLTDGACNQACWFCSFNSGEGDLTDLRKIDPDALNRALSEFYDLGTRGVEFVGGGEPTAHPGFESITHDTLGLGFEVGLITNGLLGRRITDAASRYPDGGFKYVRVSLDSGVQSTYDRLHGVPKVPSWTRPSGEAPVILSQWQDSRGDHQRVLKTIRDLRAIFPRVKSGGEPRLGIGGLIVPPFNTSREEIESMFAIADEIGVDYVVFRPAQIPHFDGIQDHWTEAHRHIKDLQKAYANSYTLFDSGSLRRWNIVEQNDHPTGTCHSKPLVMVIRADGGVAHCNLHRNDHSMDIGSIHGPGSVTEQWFSETHRQEWQNFKVDGCPLPCKHYSYNDEARNVAGTGVAVTISSSDDQKHAHINFV